MPLVLAVLALVAVAIAVNALLPRDTPPDGQGTFGSTPTTGPTAQAPTANAPTGEKTTEEGLPQGWRTYRDETGFAVAVPIGWTVVRRNGIVYFDEPNGGRLLGIDQTDQPKSDPVADWEQQEAARLSAGDFPRYERIGIRTCDYFVACADWEFRYTSRGTRVHVNNRGVVVSDNRAYGFWWSTPDSQWTASLPYLDVIFRTFQPAR